MAENNQDGKFGNLFKKAVQAGEMHLERWMTKARSEIASEEDDGLYRKSMHKDPNYTQGAQGYIEKSHRLSYYYLNRMAKKDTIVAAVIQTYQNLVAAHSSPAHPKEGKGFRIKLKDEEQALENLKRELFPSDYADEELTDDEKYAEILDDISQSNEDHENSKTEAKKLDTDQVPELKEGQNPSGFTEKEKIRIAKKVLRRRTRKKIKSIQNMISRCGNMKDRPFEDQKWDFDSFLRALVRDTLTYDQMAIEKIRTNDNEELHHWVPVDAGAIRYASPQLAQSKNDEFQTSGYDLLYPEKELRAWETEQSDALQLDPEKLEEGDYKYVQVHNGKVVRAFTPDELSMDMRNPTTEVHANGYSISELELLMQIVSSHIFTENYNHQYFSQGFSAKGILHIKSPMNRRKLESLRTQWNHMVKGNRNSWQTPIVSGMDEVKWIPLSQKHSDMEFGNWMNYIIKVICGIYQIDPLEIGFGMQEEGRGGGSLSGDNTEEKFTASRNKGLVPLLKFIQKFINRHIMDEIDPNYMLEFVGVSDEDHQKTLDRQKDEVTYKKSVNEIREEDELPPIAGADDLILDRNFLEWFTNFHPEGKALREETDLDGVAQETSDFIAGHDEQDADNVQGQVSAEEERMYREEVDAGTDKGADSSQTMKSKLKKPNLKKAKPVKIEYYKLEDE